MNYEYGKYEKLIFIVNVFYIESLGFSSDSKKKKNEEKLKSELEEIKKKLNKLEKEMKIAIKKGVDYEEEIEFRPQRFGPYKCTRNAHNQIHKHWDESQGIVMVIIRILLHCGPGQCEKMRVLTNTKTHILFYHNAKKGKLQNNMFSFHFFFCITFLPLSINSFFCFSEKYKTLLCLASEISIYPLNSARMSAWKF
jgi:hypothetical protein